MWRYSPYACEVYYHGEGEPLRTDVIFDQCTKAHFTAIIDNISKKRENFVMQDKFDEYLDKFDEYLRDENQPTRLKALTAKSYKNADHSVQDRDTNCELATYGDALLKCAFCKILFDEGTEKITEKKQNYESDEVLVKIIARNYDLLKYIRYDENDEKIPKNYDYIPKNNGNDSPSKYIATAVEALIAAIYLDNKEDFNLVVEIANHWKMLIDQSEIQ